MTHPTRTRRHLLILAAAPLATVAISWLCAGWLPEPRSQPARTMDGNLTDAPADWGDPIVATRAQRPGLTATEESWGLVLLEGEPQLLTFRRAAEVRREKRLDDFAPQEDVLVTRRRLDAGLPFPAMRWTTVRTTADLDLPPTAVPAAAPLASGLLGLDNVVFQTIFAQPDRRLPLIPLWPGFALDTLLTFAALWTALVGVPTLRRRRRSARGLCPACAYPVPEPGSRACPECGAPLPGAATETQDAAP